MLAPHPDGAKVHRGYSWPGLEKVSQVMNRDGMKVGDLRRVRDCKVCIYVYISKHVGTDDITIRKVTKSAANKT